MEKEIEEAIQRVTVNAINTGLQKTIEASFAEHNHYSNGPKPPIQAAIERVIDRHKLVIENMLDTMVRNALNDNAFNAALQERVAQKMVNVMLSKTESEFEKRVNELRSDAGFRAKITLALTQVLDQYKVPPNGPKG